MFKVRVFFLVGLSAVAGCGATALVHALRTPHPQELLLMRGTVPDSLLESPQFHDFQQVMVGKPGQAQGMGARIIASPVYQITTVNDTPNVWRNVAVVFVDAADAAIAQSGLDVGMNCYYLRNRRAAPQMDWEARIARGAVGQPCPRTPPAGSRPIFADTIGPEGDVPYAVRVHISNAIPSRPHHPVYIGVPCYRRWCTLAAVQVSNWPPFNLSGNKNNIAGWHDEQILTYESGGRRVASLVRARITPVEDLDNIKFGTNYRAAAVITVAGRDPNALGHYRTKWGLARYNWEPTVTLALRKDAAGTYWAQFSAGNETSAPKRVKWEHIALMVDQQRSRGMLVTVASTARWGIASDGDAWIRCDDGCCTVS